MNSGAPKESGSSDLEIRLAAMRPKGAPAAWRGVVLGRAAQSAASEKARGEASAKRRERGQIGWMERWLRWGPAPVVLGCAVWGFVLGGMAMDGFWNSDGTAAGAPVSREQIARARGERMELMAMAGVVEFPKPSSPAPPTEKRTVAPDRRPRTHHRGVASRNWG